MDFKGLIVDSGRRMLSKGLTVGTWGNLSVRDAKKDLIYITPSAMDYSKISPDDVAVLDMDGHVFEGRRRPSVEAGLHLAVYAARPDINAIIHTHPVASMAFACAGEDIPVLTDEAAQALGAPVKVCEYALPGTPELAKNCAAALSLSGGMACLLRSHGAVCLGRDMDGAFKTAEVLEATAEVLWRIRAMGAAPAPISRENIAWMWDFANNKYGK